MEKEKRKWKVDREHGKIDTLFGHVWKNNCFLLNLLNGYNSAVLGIIVNPHLQPSKVIKRKEM